MQGLTNAAHRGKGDRGLKITPHIHCNHWNNLLPLLIVYKSNSKIVVKYVSITELCNTEVSHEASPK